MSDIGILAALSVLRMVHVQHGFWGLLKLYIIPWFLLSHWLVSITYLQHTDKFIPHYRGKAWTFCRGAAATVDRDFLGWVGRFFFHDISHYHVIHHFFPKIPFCEFIPLFCDVFTAKSGLDNCEEATKHLKKFMGEQYLYSDTPVFEALWDSYNNCQFVDDNGESSIIVYYPSFKPSPGSVVFYRNRKGQAVMRAAEPTKAE